MTVVFVVGLGSIGTRHTRNLSQLGVQELVGFDRDPRRLSESQSGFKFTAVDSVEDGLARGPDLTVVATPPRSHIPIAMQAAEAGSHLFIEKPLSHELGGVGKLEELVEDRNLEGMVACNMRFHPGPLTVRSLVRQGRVGKVVYARLQTGSYLPNWRPGQDHRESYTASKLDGGATLDCIHELDLALWYFGPAELMTSRLRGGEIIGIDADGLAEILLEHRSGSMSSVHLNLIQRDYRRSAQVIGTEGTIYWDHEEGSVEVRGTEGDIEETIPHPEGWSPNDMYLDQMAAFLDALEGNRQIPNPLPEARRTLEIALAAKDGGT